MVKLSGDHEGLSAGLNIKGRKADLVVLDEVEFTPSKAAAHDHHHGEGSVVILAGEHIVSNALVMLGGAMVAAGYTAMGGGMVAVSAIFPILSSAWVLYRHLRAKWRK